MAFCRDVFFGGKPIRCPTASERGIYCRVGRGRWISTSYWASGGEHAVACWRVSFFARGCHVPLSSEQAQRISEAVGQKLTQPCPLCLVRAWGWGQDPILLRSQRFELAGGRPSLADLTSPPLPTLGGAGGSLASLAALATAPPPAVYPTLPVMCSNCGNTVLLNIYTLGIADIWPDLAQAKLG